MFSVPDVVMAHMCKGDMVASCVDVKVCLLTPLTGIQLWVNVSLQHVPLVLPNSSQLSGLFVCFCVEANVSSEVLMSLCLCLS